MENATTKNKLTPAQINAALRELASDEERMDAFKGICGTCGQILDGNPCWHCYESPADYD